MGKANKANRELLSNWKRAYFFANYWNTLNMKKAKKKEATKVASILTLEKCKRY